MSKSKTKTDPLQIIVDEGNTIKFYGAKNKNGLFSNFYISPIKLKGKIWQTTEHYFQAQKFAGTVKEEQVRNASGPGIAFRLGRKKSNDYPLRSDWLKVKDDVMYEAIKAKFTQHDNLKKILLSTKNHKLIEHTKRDAYWGDGGDGKGKNMLGILLMKLRKELSEEIKKEEK
ncbi:swarming motility protein ybiA (macronuclear) [Tetrahymena thermophila SB210]|uniref:Swarming motility protein ybiA n=1 Tax=Tetrahymena thermophila (strain SB210) TaxID=312017 RepID=I7M8L4_TETTS|nr:swarming motility protein ybiA [Tetrahymena thermophila SB210]EAR98402.1 swarming motility protein ybiA [Tetrahymena thermophila SB210]|eukprot:XP_001018647.1 swarming motility protein ybiA [Tetrahymena thermophila SB210]